MVAHEHATPAPRDVHDPRVWLRKVWPTLAKPDVSALEQDVMAMLQQSQIDDTVRAGVLLLVAPMVGYTSAMLLGWVTNYNRRWVAQVARRLKTQGYWIGGARGRPARFCYGCWVDEAAPELERAVSFALDAMVAEGTMVRLPAKEKA